MPRRRGWSGLSASYRAYLRRQGVTREQWQKGEPLLRKRSPAAWSRLTPRYKGQLQQRGIGQTEWREGYSARRAPPPPSDAQVAAITDRLVAGTDTAADGRPLERWYRTKRVPAHLRDQPGLNKAATAAVLSQIISPPSAWTNVVLIPAPRGQPWIMSVQFDDGSSREILIPYWLAQDVMAWLGVQELYGEPLDWDVEGTL